MIRLNIWNMYPMINPRKQHKAALDVGGGGAQAGLNESFGICHGAQNDLHRIKSRLNQTVCWAFLTKIGPFCGMIGWQPTTLVILRNMNWTENQDGPPWESVPILGRDAIKLIRWFQTNRTFFCNDSLKFCDSSLHWQRLMANLAQNIPEISAR